MLVRFLIDKQFSPDGVAVTRARAGDVMDVPARLAERYLTAGLAEPPDAKALPGSGENKVAARRHPPARGKAV